MKTLNNQTILPLEMREPQPLNRPDISNKYPHNREAELMTRVVRVESKLHHLMDGHDQMHRDLYEHNQMMVAAINTLYSELASLSERFDQFKKEWDKEGAHDGEDQ